MVNRTFYPHGQERWAASKGVTQSIWSQKSRWTDRRLRPDIKIKSYDLLPCFWTSAYFWPHKSLAEKDQFPWEKTLQCHGKCIWEMVLLRQLQTDLWPFTMATIYWERTTHTDFRNLGNMGSKLALTPWHVKQHGHGLPHTEFTESTHLPSRYFSSCQMHKVDTFGSWQNPHIGFLVCGMRALMGKWHRLVSLLKT